MRNWEKLGTTPFFFISILAFLLQYAALAIAQAVFLFDPHYSGGDFFLEYEAIQRVLTGGSAYIPPQGYFRPPFALMFVAPLAFLPPDIALLLQRVTDGGFYLAVFPLTVYLAREAGLGTQLPRGYVAALGVLWLFFAPFFHGVYSGQTNGLLLLCMTSSYLFWRKGLRVWGGLTLAAAALTKVYPGFLALLWLRKGDYSALGGAFVGGVAGSFVALALLGPQTYADFLHIIPQAIGFAESADQGNLSAGSAATWLMRQLGLPWAQLAAPLGGILSLVVVLLGASKMSKATWQPQTLLEFAALLTLMLVGGQLVEYHHLVFILPAMTVILLAIDRQMVHPPMYLALGVALELIQVQPLVDSLWGVPGATGGYLLLTGLAWYTMRQYLRKGPHPRGVS